MVIDAVELITINAKDIQEGDVYKGRTIESVKVTAHSVIIETADEIAGLPHDVDVTVWRDAPADR